ncbi:hypothetical protein KV557_41295 [Kitasatospora aureofaciens]|uniref:hypothetical protein n=1 Tax=Kitasatospora aureofaciens TaxID=1894 RepID=UPI001C48D707|nr:hypothetical protein [Kitasatospora aureofaciens]MBV6703440.1 hypothetical protein [Kitasatospora aureofaciens]
MPTASWRAGWSQHAARLDDLRDRIGHASWDAARVQADGDDRALVELLLKGTIRP